MEMDNDIIHKQLRDRWRENGRNERGITTDELYRILQRNTVLARLRRRAMMLCIVGCMGPFLIFSISSLFHISILLKICYSVFMVWSGLLSLYWYNRLGKVYHYMTIPLVQAQKKMAEIERLRRRIKICGYILGAPVIALLMYEVYISGGKEYFVGALIGLVIGGALGLYLEYKNRKQVKAVQRSFMMDDENNYENDFGKDEYKIE